VSAAGARDEREYSVRDTIEDRFDVVAWLLPRLQVVAQQISQVFAADAAGPSIGLSPSMKRECDIAVDIWQRVSEACDTWVLLGFTVEKRVYVAFIELGAAIGYRFASTVHEV
jgi:hypothetical protein